MKMTTLRKLETIIVKMEDLTPELRGSKVYNDFLHLKSRTLDIRRRAEAEQ